jgi:hypothetical protein
MPLLDSMPGYNPSVVRRRPTDIGDARNNSTGGIATDRGRNRPERQNFNQQNFQTPTTNDTLIQRARSYMYRRPVYYFPGDGGGNHNWTADGPARDLPTTRFNRNWRPIVGGSHQDQWGKHTNLATGQKQGNQLAGRAAMRPAKQNNLTVQNFRGQSYSQTTILAGQ